MSAIYSVSANTECLLHSLAATTAITMTDVFPSPVNVLKIQSDIDTSLTVLFGGAPPAAAGNSTASVTGHSCYVGPSHGPAYIQSQTGSRTIGVKNLGGSTAALIINGWRGDKILNT